MTEQTKLSVLCSLFTWTQRSKSAAKKRAKFRKFLDAFCTDHNFFPAVRLLLPNLDRERGSYGLKESVLATSLIDALGISRDSPDALRLLNWRKGGAATGPTAGNFALVASEVLQRRQGTASGGLTIRELNELLDRLASAENRAEKILVLSTLIQKTNAQEMKWIIMIILKDLKLGISEKSIFHEFHPDAEDLFNVTCDLKLVCEKLRDRNQRHKRQDIEVGKAVRPQLAKRVANATEAWKKGDPLAPLLFNIVVEGLTGLMRTAISKNMFSSYQVGSQKEDVNILQYADDTLFFGAVTTDNVRVLKSILRCFEMVSGLKINYAKSHCGCIGKSEGWCRDAAQFLNYSQLDIPFSYLGIPVGTSSKSWSVWQPIIRKFEAKLAKWKQRCLSMGGRITLINSGLTALPIYLLSFFRIPKKVVHKIVSIQRNFLWGGGIEANKIPWVNWDTVCLPKNKGGLGIKDLIKFNEALLGKWGWELVNNQNQLWARILLSKYGGWNALLFGRNSGDLSHWWKDLETVFQQQDSNSINNNLRWKVGNGVKIRFWKDKWRDDDLTLQDKYPTLYQMSTQQNSPINLMGHFVEDRWDWKINWRRNFFDHQIDMVAAFMAEIDDVHIHRSSMDILTWRDDPSGSYSTKSVYNLLKDAGNIVTEDSASKIIWNLKIPPRAIAFSWRLFQNRLPTKANLRRRMSAMSCSLAPKLGVYGYLSPYLISVRSLNLIPSIHRVTTDHLLQPKLWSRIMHVSVSFMGRMWLLSANLMVTAFKFIKMELKYISSQGKCHHNVTQYGFLFVFPWVFHLPWNFIDHSEYAHAMSEIIIQNVLVDRCILDGEMLVWDTSLKPKAARDGLDSDRQWLDVAFDILYFGDTSLIHQTLKERHEILCKIVRPVKGRLEILVPNAGINSHISSGEPCWSFIAHNVDEVERFFKETIENRDEGIVLKDHSSKWEPSDRSGKWLKLKPEYIQAGSDLDVLIIGGYYGSGRRGGEVAQFLVGLAERPSPNTHPKQFISFCRVGTGLSDDELDAVVTKLKPYFRKYEYPKKRPPSFYQVTNHSKERPDVWVDSPEKSIILSITSDIRTIESEVFSAPYSLRFPRIDRVRYDKAWYECLDVQSFIELVHSSNGTTQRDTEYGSKQDSKPKRSKSSTRGEKKNLSIVPSHLIQTDVSSIKGGSLIFSNMMFCILKNLVSYYLIKLSDEVFEEMSNAREVLLAKANSPFNYMKAGS
ncbi:DNA ligase 4 isoform D [Glycine soja]|uniref:DNA ligase 4 isoform D n=1 Tax=Glycine soja TaxID=3848 RepID=A0A445GUF6_GLYSO|nr:DNA ligase 4 isoform D [Glycine soja]